MKILEHENLGGLISEELSELLKENTNNSTDLQKASDNNGVGIQTLRYVRSRRNNLSKSNVKGVEELIKIAISNCDQKIKDSKTAKEQLKKYI